MIYSVTAFRIAKNEYERYSHETYAITHHESRVGAYSYLPTAWEPRMCVLKCRSEIYTHPRPGAIKVEVTEKGCQRILWTLRYFWIMVRIFHLYILILETVKVCRSIIMLNRNVFTHGNCMIYRPNLFAHNLRFFNAIYL